MGYACALLGQMWQVIWRYALYLGGLLAILLALYSTRRVPRDVFRKLLHFAGFTTPVFITLSSESWLCAALVLLLGAALSFPVLSLAERLPGYAGFLVEKHPGEVKRGLLLMFLSQAALVALCWGLAGAPWIVAAADAAWGFGDAAAALIGGRFGKHKTGLRLADPAKTWEGSAAMLVFALLGCFAALALFSPYGVGTALTVSLPAAAVAALVELLSRGGTDTVTVPVAAALTLWLCLA